MGILIPTQTLTGPQNPIVGALTGLTQGLAQGIPIAEQIKRRKEESDRQNIELAQQQGQLNRRNSREDASKRAAQALLQASMMNAEAPSNGFGPSSQPGATAGSGAPALSGFQTVHPGAAPGDLADLGQEQGPGTGGSPLQGPPEQGPAGQQTGYSGGHPPTGNPGTDWLFEQMHNGSLKDISVEEAEKISEAHARDLHLQAVTQHAGRLTSTIQRGLDKGAYDAVDEDGHPDPSATIEMQNIQQRIQSLDRTDPRAAAALLDQAEQAEAAARQYKAHAEAGFARRTRMDQGFQADMQNRMATPRAPGQPDVASDEMNQVYSMWKNHLIPDEKMAAAWQDASQGTLGIKQQLQQAQMQASRAAAERDRAVAAYQAQRGFKETPEGMRLQSELDTKKGVAISKSRLLNPAKPPSRLSNAKALESISNTLDKEFPKHGFKSETPEEAAKYQERKKELEKKIGFDQPDTGDDETSPQARDFLYRIQQGEFGSEEELRKAMEEAGVTEDEIHAAAGGK